MPFWSNFFSHYLLTAHDVIQDETVVAVTRYKDKDREKDQTILRSKNGMIVRQPVTGPQNYPTLIKMPYQGEFDNIHMAPRMILANVEKAIHMGETLAAPPDGRESPGPPVFDVPSASLQLDEITMAPFCAHDCFHTHWRWGKDATDAAQCGFDGMVPYKKPGAPHIPANQTLHVWLRAPNLLTYSVIVWPLSSKPIPANAWQVIMHHGSAYALDVTGFIAAYLAKFSVDAFGGQPQFYEDDTLTTPVTSSMSFSLF